MCVGVRMRGPAAPRAQTGALAAGVPARGPPDRAAPLVPCGPARSPWLTCTASILSITEPTIIGRGGPTGPRSGAQSGHSTAAAPSDPRTCGGALDKRTTAPPLENAIREASQVDQIDRGASTCTA